ncbi:MAG: imelysin family protein [Myxococcota bacterium]
MKIGNLIYPWRDALRVACVALTLTSPACTESGANGDGSDDASEDEDGGMMALPTGPEVMDNTINNTIVPDFQAFEAATEAMQAEVDTFCGAPSPETLQATQDSWRALSEAWNAVVPYNLGPLDDDFIIPKIIFVESMRQRGDDYTQTVRDNLLAALEGDETLDAAYFEGLNFNRVGLLAAEVLVFEDSREGNSTELADVLSDFVEQPRKCTYLQGVTTLLVTVADEVEGGWSVSFQEGEAFRDTMLGTELADGAEPVAGLLIALQEYLLYLKDRKLEGILDARLSGHFYPNVSAMLDGFERLLAQPEPEDAVGILDFMDAHGFEDDADTVRANLEAAKAAAAAEDREALAAAVGLLDGNVKREIPDALGVDLGLTFTDGD